MKIKPFLEIFGGLAVLLSLIFVGMEIRLNTNAIRAQGNMTLNAWNNERLLLIASDTELADISLRGRKDLSTLNDIERERYLALQWHYMNTLEAAFWQKEMGVISEADYEVWFVMTCESYIPISRLPEWRLVNKYWSNSFVAHLRQCEK